MICIHSFTKWKRQHWIGIIKELKSLERKFSPSHTYSVDAMAKGNLPLIMNIVINKIYIMHYIVISSRIIYDLSIVDPISERTPHRWKSWVCISNKPSCRVTLLLLLWLLFEISYMLFTYTHILLFLSNSFYKGGPKNLIGKTGPFASVRLEVWLSMLSWFGMLFPISSPLSRSGG